MSDFVNFQKRSVALPGGCKDLIDVLRRPAEEQPTVTRGHRSDGGVRQVATYLGRLFESRSELATLMISSADENLTAMFYLRGGGQVFVLILIASDPALEAAVRSFYAKRGIQPVQTYPIPKQEGGGLGWGLVFPMPSLSIETAHLTGELLSHLSSAGQEVELHFRYYQPTRTVVSGQ
jgi:hypothetical protein